MTKLAVLLHNGQETIYTVSLFTFCFLPSKSAPPELVILLPEGGQKNIPIADIAYVCQVLGD